jgi:hypothetical protein
MHYRGPFLRPDLNDLYSPDRIPLRASLKLDYLLSILAREISPVPQAWISEVSIEPSLEIRF